MSAARARKRSAGIDATGIDLRRLRYFLAVCDHGGFLRAAEAIGVAQPALTRQVKLLEQEIGQQLLERDVRGARPSEAGRFLVTRSRRHLEGLDVALRDLWQTFTDTTGEVTLGICPSIAPLFLDDLVRHLGVRHPNLSLSVIQAYSGDLKSLMQAGRIDVALTYRGSILNGASSQDLLSERLALVCGAKARRPKSAISIGALKKLKLILPSQRHELRSIIDRVCAAQGVHLTPDLELDSLDAVKAMLMSEELILYAILPFHSVQQEVASGIFALADISHSDMRRTVSLVASDAPRNASAVKQIGARAFERARELKAKLPAVF
jgi:LysR family nitrogen assimilation transcriptional regulator